MREDVPQTGSRSIVVDELLRHRPETIWTALTSGELMGRWLGMVPEGFEPVRGNRFTYRTTPAGAWDGTITCEVLEVVPNVRLAYSWRGGHEGNVGYGSRLDTVVTFTLEAAEGGTRLRLVHAGFVLPANETAYRKMGDGWTTVVPRIGGVAGEQTSPKPSE